MSADNADMGEAAAGNEQNGAAAPYAEYDASIKAKFTGVLVKGTPELYKSHNTVLAATQAVLANDATYGPGQEYSCGEGVKTGIWAVTRDYDGTMPDWYAQRLWEVQLDLMGAQSGVELMGKWHQKINCGAMVSELLAAHVAYNAANGTTHALVFEPDASRFEGKRLRNAQIVGSTASATVVKQMGAALRATAYGPPKYLQCLDASPRPKLGSGTWVEEWKELDIEYKFPAMLIGFDFAEFEDSSGSGAPLGVLRAQLGDVHVVQTYAMRGFEKTRRVLLACPMSMAREVQAKLEGCTEQAKGGHGIVVEGNLVSVVRPSALVGVYEGLHGLEVREGNGGGMKAKLEELADQLMQVESAAADERARAAEEMRAAAARQIAMAVEIERIGSSAEQMRQALDAASARATEAEKVAAERHDAMQDSQVQLQAAQARAAEQATAQAAAQAKAAEEAGKQAAAQAELLDLNKRMAFFMTECAAGRNPLANSLGGIAGPREVPALQAVAGAADLPFGLLVQAPVPGSVPAPVTEPVTEPMDEGAPTSAPGQGGGVVPAASPAAPGGSTLQGAGPTAGRAEPVHMSACVSVPKVGSLRSAICLLGTTSWMGGRDGGARAGSHPRALVGAPNFTTAPQG